MSFWRKRIKRQSADRAYERSAGVKRSDPEATRFGRGNVYSSADIEALEREKLAYWRRKR